MKKIIITTVVATVVSATAFAQGLVNFSGGGTIATRASTNSVPGGPATGPTAATAGLYYYALFASSSQTSVNGQTAGIFGLNANYVFNNLGGGTPSTGWELVGIGANIASIGRFTAQSQGTTSSGQGPINTDNSLTVQGIAGGATASLVAIGWSANIGTTLQALETWYTAGAADGWIGQSAVGSIVLGDGASIPTGNLFGAGTGQVSGILMGTTVPEPTTLALAAMGVSSLLLFRRKK